MMVPDQIRDGYWYQIKVAGEVDSRWLNWAGGMRVSVQEGATILTGPVRDQVALRGMLNALWDLNLVLISVVRLEPDPLDL